MPRRRSYPNVGELRRTAVSITADLRAILPMYARLVELAGTSPRRESVAVRGGGDSDPTGELAMPVRVDESLEPEEQKALGLTENERRRRHARRIGRDLDRLARDVAQIRGGLEANVGPTPGFRQPTKARGWISGNELAESLAKQEARLRIGVE